VHRTTPISKAVCFLAGTPALARARSVILGAMTMTMASAVAQWVPNVQCQAEEPTLHVLGDIDVRGQQVRYSGRRSDALHAPPSI
jgi:hypothetical protein